MEEQEDDTAVDQRYDQILKTIFRLAEQSAVTPTAVGAWSNPTRGAFKKDKLLIAVCPFFMAMSYFFGTYYDQKQIEIYYYGSSDDPDRRLGYHNSESKGFTQRYRPWKFVFRSGI